jgi:uncharacterized protein YoxC
VVYSSVGMAVRLRRQFLKLLDEDKEFRYTVAGYLGLGEILKRLDSIEENIRKIWEEIRGLREGQEKLWEAQNRLWEEVKALREGQEKLWDGQNKLWEGQNRLWEEVKALREGQEKLWASHRRLENYMRSAFGELRTALGVTYEMHAAAYLTMMLYKMGYEKAEVVSKSFVEDGEIVEVDLFNEEPLVVGEVTLAVKDVGDAEREVEKVMRRVGLMERVFGRRVFVAVLSVANLYPEVADTLKSLAARNGIRLILGREMKEALQL